MTEPPESDADAGPEIANPCHLCFMHIKAAFIFISEMCDTFQQPHLFGLNCNLWLPKCIIN